VDCLLWAELVACQATGQEMQTSRMALFGNLAGKFGMTPSERAKVHMPAEENTGRNRFAELDEHLQ